MLKGQLQTTDGKVIPVAVKYFKNLGPAVEDEYQVLKALKGTRYVTEIYGKIEKGGKDKKFALVLQLLPGGDLEKYAKRNDPSLEEIRKLMMQLVIAVQLIHSKFVVHGDIKPDNIMFDEQLNPHLIDFGFARQYSAETPPPPDSASYEFDIVSLGMTFIHLLCEKAHLAKVVEEPFDEFEGVHAHYKSFLPIEAQYLHSLMLGLGEQLPTIPEIMRHPFFDGCDWTALGALPIQ